MADSRFQAGSRSIGSHEVLLIEDAAPVTAPRIGSEARTRWASQVAFVLVLAVAVANLALLRETRVRAGLRAEAPGILAPLREPLTQRWSVDVALWPGVIAAADLLVGVESLRTGAFSLVALDPDDGSVAWRALPGETDGRTAVQGCRPSTPRAAEDVAGDPDGSDVAPIVCLVARPAAARLDNHRPLDVFLLDARTGEVREGAVTIPADVGRVPESQVNDGSLADMTVRPTPDGGLVALDPRSPSVRWTVAPGPFRGVPAVLDTTVLVWGADQVVGLDGWTGDVLWALPARSDAPNVLTDGRVVLVPQHHPTLGAVLSAVDIGTGYVEWTSDIPEDLDLFVLEGHLYGASPESLVALG